MNPKESKINEFIASLNSDSEMSDKQFVTLSGAGIAPEDPGDKNKGNDRCCNTTDPTK